MPKERIEVLRGGRSWALDDFRTLTSFGSEGSSTETSRGRQGARRAAARRDRSRTWRAAVRARARSGLLGAERGARRAGVDRLRPAAVEVAACRLRGTADVRHLRTARDAATTSPVNEELVTTMRDSIHHRGPDDGGSWTSPSDRVALGHRRLSIVDLSPAGHQPMSNEDGTVWITFNGEIYNHTDAAARARGEGPPSIARTRTPRRSSTSTRRRAPRCVERLHGMFALRDLGRAHAASCSSRATASARSRSTTHSRRAASSSARRSRRCSSTPRSRRSSTRRRSTTT